jgi:putative copper export protein
MIVDAAAGTLVAIKLGLYVTASMAAGFGLHAALGVVEREQRQRMLMIALVCALGVLGFAVARAVSLHVQIGGGFWEWPSPARLRLMWSALGPSSAALAAGVPVFAAALVWRSRGLAALGAILFAGSFGLTGHAHAADRFGLLPALVALHVLLASFWMVSVVALWPRRGLPVAVLQRRLERFSTIAVIAVPVLIAAGLWTAWELAGGWAGLFETSYGQLLLAKLGLAAAALGLGAINKAIVTPWIMSRPAQGRAALSATLGVDGLLFGFALIAAAWATTLTGPGASR